MRTPRRTRLMAAVATGGLALTAWVGALAPARAQLADPGAGVGDAVGDVGQTVNDAVDGAQLTVDDTVATATDAVNQVVDGVQDTVSGLLDDPADPKPNPDPGSGGGNEGTLPSGPATNPSGQAGTAPESSAASPASSTVEPAPSAAGPSSGPVGVTTPGPRTGDGSRGRFLPTTRVMAVRDAEPDVGVREPGTDVSPASLPRPLVLAAAGLLTAVALGLAWAASPGSSAVPARWPRRLPAAIPVRA